MEINIRNKFGWKEYQESGIRLWFSGYLIGDYSVKKVLLELIDFSNNDDINIEKLSKWVNGITGHFSLVVKFSENKCFLAVDKICSIPVFDIVKDNRYAVSNHAPYLKKAFGMIDRDVSLQSLLEISMSGFSIGDKTIYRDMNRLMAGECIFWNKGERQKKYYYTYSPWKSSLSNYDGLKDEFSKVCLVTIKKLIKSVGGRQIVVPLSAGNDSRLIVSCLRILSYKNVICFTYGRKGNYEVDASEKVASTLGYKWIYIRDTIRKKRAFFKSGIYDDYVKTFESYASVPNTQDIYEVYTLKSMNIIDDDAVIVNGNSGDFISGGHVPKALKLNKGFSIDNNENWELFLEKHYSIWRSLRTNLSDKIIISELSKKISKRFQFKKQNKVLSYSMIESMEYIGRQSRLVMNQQRAYDFIGHEWRLPFWSEDFLIFWEKVPPQYKVGQALYKDVLMENNWGGAWKDININKKLIRPWSLFLIRLFVKALSAPFGKKVWHRIEKNLFYYWMHPSYAVTITSYWNTLFDKYGQRSINSWTADQFVKRNGFSGVTNVLNKVRSLHKYK